MINPNETNGKRIPGTNKVEMSTQTHDLNYLSTKLNFKKRSPSLSFDRTEVSRPIKNQKKGFAMKEFCMMLTKKTSLFNIFFEWCFG